MSMPEAPEVTYRVRSHLEDLRDQFAAAALSGLIVSTAADLPNNIFRDDHLAREAYRLADAMLRVREHLT